MSPDKYKKYAYAFRKRIRFLRKMNDSFWNGDFACPDCGRDTNNGWCRDCMHGQIPETPSHEKARTEGFRAGLEVVLRMVERCDYPIQDGRSETADIVAAIRALLETKSNNSSKMGSGIV